MSEQPDEQEDPWGQLSVRHHGLASGHRGSQHVARLCSVYAVTGREKMGETEDRHLSSALGAHPRFLGAGDEARHFEANGVPGLVPRIPDISPQRLPSNLPLWLNTAHNILSVKRLNRLFVQSLGHVSGQGLHLLFPLKSSWGGEQAG